MHDPLKTRLELRDELNEIRQMFKWGYIASVVLVGLFINVFMAFLLAIPLWLVMAASYTAVDNYYEKQYREAIEQRKRNI